MRLLLSLMIGVAGLVDRALAVFGGESLRVELTNPLGEGTGFPKLMDRITGFLLEIATPAVAVMVLVGGLQMMFAGGKPESFSKGKNTILYAVAGYAVVLVSRGVTSIIKSIVAP